MLSAQGNAINEQRQMFSGRGRLACVTGHNSPMLQSSSDTHTSCYQHQHYNKLPQLRLSTETLWICTKASVQIWNNY